jgi:hypothetical protein
MKGALLYTIPILAQLYVMQPPTWAGRATR